jgi:hypothetical protein
MYEINNHSKKDVIQELDKLDKRLNYERSAFIPNHQKIKELELTISFKNERLANLNSFAEKLKFEKARTPFTRTINRTNWETYNILDDSLKHYNEKLAQINKEQN